MADQCAAGRVAESPPSLFGESWSVYFHENGLCPETLARFTMIINDHYQYHRREFGWRDEISPYRVLVSEVMLQQTQTKRVIPVFDRFIEAFPDFQTLAEAPLSRVLGCWKGLGYNRRAKYLQDAAALVQYKYGGVLPDTPEILVGFPGIGPATAASICVFAFDKPLAFIETNIRTVYLHFFFPSAAKVSDRELLPLVEMTLDHQHPRQWYYALMDYGVLLKRLVGNVSRLSSHYRCQPAFAGSDRQLRGRILRLLLERRPLESAELPQILGEESARVERLVEALCDDGLVVRDGFLLTLD